MRKKVIEKEVLKDECKLKSGIIKCLTLVTPMSTNESMEN